MARHKHQAEGYGLRVIKTTTSTLEAARIESGVTIPPHGGRGSPMNAYKLITRLKKGECVVVPVADKTEERRVATRLGAHANKTFGNGGYTVRQMPDGVRVWRLR